MNMKCDSVEARQALEAEIDAEVRARREDIDATVERFWLDVEGPVFCRYACGALHAGVVRLPLSAIVDGARLAWRGMRFFEHEGRWRAHGFSPLLETPGESYERRGSAYTKDLE